DENGRILIPGYYDRVEKPTEEELEAWRRLPFEEEHYRKTEIGSTVLTGEKEYSVLYRTWARPTLEVHGIAGAFPGPGAKTVIPARACVKISMRLVPDQRPDEIFKLYRDYVNSLVPAGIQLKVRQIHTADPILIRTDNHFVQAAAEAMREVFGKDT